MIYKIICVYLLILIIPFVLISFYNHPSADDFCYANTPRATNLLKSQIITYNTWTSRYTSTALLSIFNPLTYSWIVGYKIVPIILGIALLGALNLFIQTYLNEKRLEKHLLGSLIILFTYIINMPSLVEGIYWMSGAATYQVGGILSIVLISLLLKQSNNTNKDEIIYFLIFLIGGTNEISLIFLVLYLPLILLYLYRKKQINIKFTTLCLCFLIMTLSLNLLSPGNKVREAQHINSHNLEDSIFIMDSQLKAILWSWLENPSIILSILFLGVWMILNPSINIKLNFKELTVFTLLLPIFLILSFFISPWVIGTGLPNRSVNLIFLYCLIIAFIIISQLITHINNSVAYKLLPTVLIVLLTVTVLTFLKPNGNLMLVHKDLTKSAYIYDKFMTYRYKNLEECRIYKIEECIIKTPTHRPKALFWDEVSKDSSFWINLCTAEYFNIKSVKKTD